MNVQRRRLALAVLLVPWHATRAGPITERASAPSEGAALNDLTVLRTISVEALQSVRSADLRRARGASRGSGSSLAPDREQCRIP